MPDDRHRVQTLHTTSYDLRLATQPPREKLALITLCLAVLVAQVDTAVANLAVVPIGTAFQARAGALQWVIDSYNLVYAVLLLTGGLLADLWGRRRMFMIGVGIFTLASLVCAFAPSVTVLIAGRAVTGLGAALMIPASLAIIRVTWTDPARRGRTLGIWAACNGLAMAIGATLGGVLIHHFGWRSIFLVVIPLGLIAMVLAPLSIRETSDPQGRDFDVTAQVLGALAIAGLAFAAIEFHEAPLMGGMAFVVALIALVLFINVEGRRGATALVPLDLFRSKIFTSALAATAAMTFGMYGALFLMPMTWQATGRFDATGAGLALMPMALVFVATSPFSGGLAARFGNRPLATGGVAIIASGLALIALSAGAPSVLGAEIGLALTGLGMGFATGPLTGAAVGAVPAARSGTASALLNVARMVGASMGVALLGAIHVMAGAGATGLRVAMLTGAGVQVCAVLLAWRAWRRAEQA
ncbi:MFS transporter [Methylocella sp. CPCC 101449]|uniref:MFS transporter n=1 Tax=Methylocella sp. CPCC 101449 TaxID=2987531 RepID=UPI002891A718|nr:MFS transporter [Methylocella sp. CPCC 101449]MDT2024305.1 MFS transporter [Methylocella sp. CPCC 101449]